MEFILILFSLYFITFLFAVLRETTFSMVFSLIVVFFIACILVFNLGFYFLGFMILIIYLGAIAVLFLFMVMLFDRAEYKIFTLEYTSNKKYINIFFCLMGSICLSFLIFYLLDFFDASIENISYTKEDLTNLKSALFLFNNYNLSAYDNVSLFIGSNYSYETFNLNSNFSDAELIGFDLYIKYFFLLIMSGLGLLVAMIGCIIITKSSFLDKFERRTQRIEKQLSRFKI